MEVSSEYIDNTENRITSSLQQIEVSNCQEVEDFLETISLKLHPTHYLMLLSKRHLIGLYSVALTKLETSKLKKVIQYCEEINATYDIIDPGLFKDKGAVLLALCEAKKTLAKRLFNSNLVSEEEFKMKVQECTKLFQRSQECMILRLKKENFMQSSL